MSIIPSFFTLLLCISMHACTARHLGIVKIEHKKESVGESIREDIIANDASVMNQEPNIGSTFVRESSGQAPTMPVVSVSWQAPNKNNYNYQNKNPGLFHSDYSMPKMRTPSHN